MDRQKQTDYKRQFNAEKYDRLYPFVPKGRKAEIQAAADAVGETLNEYIVNAIDSRMAYEESERPFVPPPGEWCEEDCKKRAELIQGDRHSPWCGAYGIEITGQGEDGVYRKCTGCLKDTPEE